MPYDNARIIFDARWYFSGPPSNRLVTRELLAALKAFRQFDQLSALVRGGTLAAKQLESLLPGVEAIPVGGLTIGTAALGSLPLTLRKQKADVCIIQNFAPLYGAKRRIVFVYDAIFARSPNLFSWRERAYLSLIKPLIRSHDLVCTISATERQHLITGGFVSPDRCFVVPLAPRDEFRNVSDAQRNAAISQLGLPSRYLLCIGRVNIRKNVGAVLAGALQSRTLSPETPLVLVGPQDRRQETGLAALISQLGGRLIQTGWISDDLMPGVLSLARGLIFLSEDEGFGLPPLEALAAGVPAIVASSDISREVIGSAAEIVNSVNDSQEVARAIDRMMTDDDLVHDLRNQGLIRVQRYSWSRSAEALSLAIDVALTL